MTKTETLLQTLLYLPFKHLTPLQAREILLDSTLDIGAWGGVVVKALRY
jgi:hypothetical protein